MTKYIQGVVENFIYQEELGSRSSVTPAANHLFKINEKSVKLDAERADEFHTTVAKCLFVCKRGRPYIQTTVAFYVLEYKNQMRMIGRNY